MTIQRTSSGVINAIVLDPQPLWRRALESMLARSGVRVVAQCSSAEDIADTAVFRPHLIVADPDGVEGFCERLCELRNMLPQLRTIIVTSRDEAPWKCDLEITGAVEFIPKTWELDAIEGKLNAAIEAQLQWSRLTARELEILALVADGRSNREVAAALWISDQTVKFHLANVYRKVGVGGRSEAVDLARSEGILPLTLESSDGKEDDEDCVPASLG
jgi:DNA-binding NarL/FixJ family response regulator